MSNHYVLVFDVDGTLAPFRETMDRSVSEGLYRLEQAGHTVVLASGKPCGVLEGMARGIGLSDPIVIGENGSCAGKGYSQPPLYVLHRPVHFDALQFGIGKLYPKVPFQQNYVNITALPHNANERRGIEWYVRSKGYMDREDVTVYVHPDAVEILPSGNSKATAVARLKKQFGWKRKRIVAIGDGQNDVCLREVAGAFYAVGSVVSGDKQFKDTAEMMAFMRLKFEGSKKEQAV